MYGADSESKIMLAGMYISRIPLKTSGASTAPTAGGAGAPDPGRNAISANDLTGRASLYAPLAKGQDPKGLALELRPEPPMLVVLDGEYEKGSSNAALTKLTDALKASKFQDIRPNNYQDIGVKYAETPLIYSYYALERNETVKQQGAPKPEVAYTTFHLPMRMDDPEDPDLVPTDAPPEKEKTK
jgi:hypothetical protein